MICVMTRLVAVAATLLLIGGAFGAHAQPETDTDSTADAARLRSTWSLTVIGQYTELSSPEDDNDVGGWFDQYEFTPNKSSDFPFQLGAHGFDALGH